MAEKKRTRWQRRPGTTGGKLPWNDWRNATTWLKKARRWLEANNIDYRFHDYRVDGLDSELLNGFINELGWEALLNTRGTTWRKLDETTRNKITDAASAAALMTEMPAIIKRPLLCAPGKPMLLGFSDSSYQQFFHEV